jgi:transcriptional regulator with XRE-family HTH domain
VPEKSTQKRLLPTPESKRLGQRLQVLRQRVGLTQEQVAARLGRDYRTISALENGRTHWRANDADRWAEAFGISKEELEVALGFGYRPAHDSDFKAAAVDALGPDQGELLAEVVEELADWPDVERRAILQFIKVQTFNWPRRPDRS